MNETEVEVEETPKFKNIGKEIEKIKSENPDMNYIDCTVEVATRLGIDTADMKGILPKPIKEKIEADALQMNLLKYKTNTLI